MSPARLAAFLRTLHGKSHHPAATVAAAAAAAAAARGRASPPPPSTIPTIASSKIGNNNREVVSHSSPRKGTRLLGLDVGTRRIGVAISDPLGVLSVPHGIIEWDGSLHKPGDNSTQGSAGSVGRSGDSYGRERMGFSSDAEHAMIEEVKTLVEMDRVCGLVIGWPLQMDGTRGVQCTHVYEVARALARGGLGLPMTLWDERLTTDSARQIMSPYSKENGRDCSYIPQSKAVLRGQRAAQLSEQRRKQRRARDISWQQQQHHHAYEQNGDYGDWDRPDCSKRLRRQRRRRPRRSSKSRGVSASHHYISGGGKYTRGAHLDDISASLILQGFLDYAYSSDGKQQGHARGATPISIEEAGKA